MGLDRPPAERQPVGDLGVTEPFGNQKGPRSDVARGRWIRVDFLAQVVQNGYGQLGCFLHVEPTARDVRVSPSALPSCRRMRSGWRKLRICGA